MNIKSIKSIILAAALAFSTYTVNAQCATDEMREEFKHNHPEDVTDLSKLEAYTPNTRRATKYIIPVVFHVVHTYGPENISKEQIEEQIRILNEDFSFTNPNKANIRSEFVGRAADCEIEFRLAQIDSAGNCFDGIHRVYNRTHVQVRDQVKTAVPGWPHTKYLNIWTVSSISTRNGQEGTVLGYAYLPSSTNSKVDGIVVRADAVGDTVGTARYEGSTLTHEIGHYFGLLHPFQGGCNDDDFSWPESRGICTDDTPPVAASTTNQTCNKNSNSCSNDFPDEKDMWENYMDYSNGNCQAMFTANQKKYMHYWLGQSPRKSLHTSSNLISTGVELPTSITEKPMANFYASKKVVCVGEPIQFFDASCKAKVESRQWTLNGANIASTNSENPVVTYSQEGLYEVKLKVSNSKGEDTKIIKDFIEVRNATGGFTYILEDVENDSYFNEGWRFNKVEGNQFLASSEASYNGSKSFKINIGSSTPSGTTYYMQIPAVDMREYVNSSPKISFMVGYRKPNDDLEEKLRLYLSTDCGNTWDQKVYRFGNGLAASAIPVPNFVPQDKSDWRRISYNLFSYRNEKNLMFRIEVESGSGNPVYIDDVNISQYYTSINEVNTSSKHIGVYPNPNDGNMKIEIEGNANEKIDISLLDVTGKEVTHIHSGYLLKGINTFEATNKTTISSGIYHLRVTINGVSTFRKVSIVK